MKKTNNENSLFFLILIFLSVCGFVIGFAIYCANTNTTISQLQQQNQQLLTSQASLETNVIMLTMHSVTSTTRYVQNGTCVLGFAKYYNVAIANLNDFSDYVFLNYTLKEVYLSNGVPFTVLQISSTPRPVMFKGFLTPPPNQFNFLNPLIQFFNPPINQLDSLSSYVTYFPYSYVTASKIKLSPDCVSSLNCTKEYGDNPYYLTNGYFPNTISLRPRASGAFGNYTVMEFYWGDPRNRNPNNPTDIYNFTGTTVEFTDALEILLLN